MNEVVRNVANTRKRAKLGQFSSFGGAAVLPFLSGSSSLVVVSPHLFADLPSLASYVGNVASHLNLARVYDTPYWIYPITLCFKLLLRQKKHAYMGVPETAVAALT